MENYNTKDFLLFALQHFGIEVDRQDRRKIYLEQGYMIEIEGKKLFKLLHRDQVVAPFANVEVLCKFIKDDMALNEEG